MSHEARQSESIYNQPDRFEMIMVAILILFFVAVFANLGFISTTATFAERILAYQYLGIAALGTAGLAIRGTFQRLSVRRGNDAIEAVPLAAPTIYESKNPSSIFQSLFYFGVAFIVQAVMCFVVMSLPLSFYGFWSVQMLVISVIGAVGEELFFSYFLTGVLVQKIKWMVIPATSIIFVWYHFLVYQTLTALLYVGIMRVVYSTVYLFSRRLSSVTLAHVLNNLIVGLRV
ncbi:MAG: CPBP family intramembrane metalloprotease [Candidatus Helarchaeota archaeon]|nr:CPBP family intramembrane metalloprotease [Candidatus Helarchaeota archaeon]